MNSVSIGKNRNVLRVETLSFRTKEQEYIVGQNARLTLVLVGLGEKTSAWHLRVRLAGIGANAQILGLLVGTGSTSLSLNTLQHHTAPDTVSNLLVKSVLTGSSQFLYDGAIRVEKNAQKTDAYQRNENLVLSPNAHTESRPVLEIAANDVRCTHGATVGQPSREQLWYLATRGLAQKEARMHIVTGFLDSVLAHIPDLAIKKRITDTIAAAL